MQNKRNLSKQLKTVLAWLFINLSEWFHFIDLTLQFKCKSNVILSHNYLIQILDFSYENNKASAID